MPQIVIDRYREYLPQRILKDRIHAVQEIIDDSKNLLSENIIISLELYEIIKEEVEKITTQLKLL
jgi:methylase of polypeptide subunit release factors